MRARYRNRVPHRTTVYRFSGHSALLCTSGPEIGPFTRDNYRRRWRVTPLITPWPLLLLLSSLAACHSTTQARGDAAVDDAGDAWVGAVDAAPDGPIAACADVFTGPDPCDSALVGAPGITSTTVCLVSPPAGNADATLALQQAIDTCATEAGGGTVEVTAGVYEIGTITLRSNMVFHLDPGAVLQGIIPANTAAIDALYPAKLPITTADNTTAKQCRRALVYADSVTNLRIEGEGTIDGNGGASIWAKSAADGDAGVADNNRPIALWIARSTNVTVAGITVKSAAMWSFVNTLDTYGKIDHVTVLSPDPNERDGLDLIDSQHICVQGSAVSSEDDSICLKSGGSAGVADVHVKDCSVHGANVASGMSNGNGLKLGTPSFGPFGNICFDHVSVSHYKEAAMAVVSVDGSAISNVMFTGITLDTVGAPFYVMLGNRYTSPGTLLHGPGSIGHLRFEHILGSSISQPWGSSISGTKFTDTTGTHLLQIFDVEFRDVALQLQGTTTAPLLPVPEYDGSKTATPNGGQYPHPQLWGELPAWGLFLRHVDQVSFDGIDASVDGGDTRAEVIGP